MSSRHVDCKESNMAAERATTLALPIWWAHCLHSLHRFFRMPCQQSRLPPHSLHLFFLRLCSQGRPPPWVCFALGIRAMFCPAERGAASPTTNACASTRSSVIGADSAADAPESVGSIVMSSNSSRETLATIPNPVTVRGATASVIITALVVSPTFPTSILYALYVGA